MARIETWFNQDLKKPVKVQYLDGNVFSQDSQGNIVGVNVFDNGAVATLSGTVAANVIRSDGATVAVTGGTLSGNKASVVLPASAYAVPGVISIIIKLTSGSVITTLCAVVANVYQSSTDSAVDPGTIIPSIETLIAAIDAAVASIPADYSSLWTSLAPAFNTNTNYTAGQHVTYNGGFYRFNVNHPAGAWNSSHVALTSIGNDFDNVTSLIGYNANNVIVAKGIITSVSESLTLGNYTNNTLYSFTINETDAAYITDLPSQMAGKAGKFDIMTFAGSWSFAHKTQILIDFTSGNALYTRSSWSTTWTSWSKYVDDALAPSGNLESLPSGVTTLAGLANNTIYLFRLSSEAVAAITDMPTADTQFTIMTFGGETGFNAKCQIFFGMNGRKDIYMRQLWAGNTLGWQYINPADPTRRTNIYLGYTNPDGIAATGFVDACTKAAQYDYPTIHIAEGEYDIYTELGGSTYFSDTSHTTQPFIVPANCEIICHGNVILSLEVPDSVAASNPTLMTATSVVHTNGTGLRIENVTIKGKNIRYNLHDESSAMGWATIVNSLHEFKDVTFIMQNNGYGHGSNIGCGSASSGTYIYDGCLFINNANDNIHFHTWYNSAGERIHFKDCGFHGNAYSIGLGVHGENECEVEVINCYGNHDCRIYSESGDYTVNCFKTYFVGGNIQAVVQSSITSNPYTPQYIGSRS